LNNFNDVLIYFAVPTVVLKIVALNNIIDGEELLLTCNVIGNPPAEISWYKGNLIYLVYPTFYCNFQFYVTE